MNSISVLDTHVTAQNSQALDFVLAAVFCEAISIEEMHRWAQLMIEQLAEPPFYLFELMEFTGPLAHIDHLIDFQPQSELNPNDEKALAGIADCRGIKRFEQTPTKQQAAKALAQSPQILNRFKAQFPFISLPI